MLGMRRNSFSSSRRRSRFCSTNVSVVLDIGFSGMRLHYKRWPCPSPTPQPDPEEPVVKFAIMRTAIPILFSMLLATAAQAQEYDVVLAHGRVLDPASDLDAVRYVGIRGAKIGAISETPLQGRTVVDASGLVVAPGFIDLHSHGQTPENYRFKARDGVTTALELEVGAHPVAGWYAQREGRALINYGASSGDLPARIAVMHDSGTFLPRDRAVERAATPQEFSEILDRVGRGLDEGAPGIGLGIQYLPHESRAEVLSLFRLAAARKVPLFVHMRSSGPLEPGVIDALQEIIADAAATGASVHVVH